MMMLPAGCGRPRNSGWFTNRSTHKLLEIALEDRRPDERRKAVGELAGSRDAAADWAVKAFDTIARTDPDPMVRVEAVRALGRADRGAVAPTLIKLLSSADAPLADVNPPAPAQVRWEAAILLERLSANRKIAESDREQAMLAFIARVERDPDRNVRLCAIGALRHYRDRRVVPVLIAALRTRDYALQFRAEASLHVLTAQAHDRDADAWDRWLAATRDPFAPAQGARRKSSFRLHPFAGS